MAILSPKAIELFIKHLNCIDIRLSKKLLSKRPWLETTLTQLLCDLLDEDTQPDENIDYSVFDLNDDLSRDEGIVKLNFSINTHQYSGNLEGKATQSDLGFVINYRDYLVPSSSWSSAWLMQAKRVYPDSTDPVKYSENSKFDALNSKQTKDLERLKNTINLDFVRYLLYCPRPNDLGKTTKAKLKRLRSNQLYQNIFDYSNGLTLWDDLKNGEKTVSAGIFVSKSQIQNLGYVHKKIFEETIPLSWFFVQHYFNNPISFSRSSNNIPILVNSDTRISIDPHSTDLIHDPDKCKEEWAHGIVKGQENSINKLTKAIDGEEINFQPVPKHTISVDISIGADLGPESDINLDM